MPRHDDMDYPHQTAWCTDCWNDAQQSRQLMEMRRANDLKAQELELLEDREDRPRRTYTYKPPLPPPPVEERKTPRGGADVRPRSSSIS